jgi:hypothetical protein
MVRNPPAGADLNAGWRISCLAKAKEKNIICSAKQQGTAGKKGEGCSPRISITIFLFLEILLYLFADDPLKQVLPT